MTDKVQEFITKHCPEADAVLFTEDKKLAFHAGPDPIKNLTKKQITELNSITSEEERIHNEQNELNELRREAEIDAQQKKIYENIETQVEGVPEPAPVIKSKYETFTPEQVQPTTVSVDSNMPTLSATRYNG